VISGSPPRRDFGRRRAVVVAGGGERTPHNDANVRGAFAGLGHESDRHALALLAIAYTVEPNATHAAAFAAAREPLQGALPRDPRRTLSGSTDEG
jgi:hypothetical protein